MKVMHPSQVPPAQRLSSNPPSDFAGIFRAEFSYVWNTLTRLGIRQGDLEDVTHDVFCGVHRHLSEYDPSRPLRPWLFSFAFRAASDYRRLARHRAEVVGLHIERPDPGPSADDLVISAEERALIEAALQEVSLERRAILMLHEIDGCPIPAVAAALSIPLNTAYSRLRLARIDLAQAVRRIESSRRRHVVR
jgi:RNA polymerase sigma-70 factor (ECF subfamily)